MAARVLHALNDAPDLGAAQDCGTPISRRESPFSGGTVVQFLPKIEREIRRSAFVDALKKRGAVAAVARAWGTSETLVRQVKHGQLPLTDERIAALPAGLRAAVEARLAAPTIQLRLAGL